MSIVLGRDTCSVTASTVSEVRGNSWSSEFSRLSIVTCEFSIVIVLRSRERFLVTVTVLVGDTGIDSIAFQIRLLVSLVTTLVELSIEYPPRALGRTHSTDSYLVQISYTVVHIEKMHHISEPPLKAPIINMRYYFFYRQTNFTN